MSLFMANIPLGLQDEDQVAFDYAQKKLRLASDQIKQMTVYKRSLDARKRGQIHFVVSVRIQLHRGEEQVLKRCKLSNVTHRPDTSYNVPQATLSHRPIVVGFGPAGLFCAYLLALAGCAPIVLERGGDIDYRVQAIDRFWSERMLNTECNVQFGEGGAGTFSDGKLTTRISDPRCDFVLATFAKFGAPSEILTKAKPHIGTDKLREVLVSMRKEIKRLGGEILFHHRVDDLKQNADQTVTVVTPKGDFVTADLVLAVGHSARDTFRMLLSRGLPLEAKSFSVGARIEHRQSTIDQGLYGNLAGHPKLPQGEYQLSHRQQDRAVYTFCMCPGGTVVPAASNEQTVVVNGMSEFARDQDNANSALVVSVDPKDFGEKPLDGVAFQEQLEHKAFTLAGSNYRAPFTTADCLLGKTSHATHTTVTPSYALGVEEVDFNQLLPSFVVDMMRTGLQKFDQKLHGFATGDAVLTGIETRTSSPVRILRGSNGVAVGFHGIYPCGEGAGYAGGIMSAAVDGMKIAENILNKAKSYA